MGNLLISVSGIRGIVGESLTPEVALSYAQAFGRYSKRGKIILGRDTRYHGAMISAAVASGLMNAGCDVIDIGVATTPQVEFVVKKTGAAGGIAVTASHNPIEYNALKLIGQGGKFLNQVQGNKFLKLYASINGTRPVSPKKIGMLDNQDNWGQVYIDALLGIDLINPRLIKSKRFKVVADCVNGTSSHIASGLFNALGCRLKLINAIPDGRFPHPPEPIPDNLKQLSRAVKEFGADIGFAFDPDSDRMAMVDETGKPIGEEYTLALGMRYILKHKKGPVAVNLSSSMINDYVAKEAGVKIYRTKVGEINVTEKMQAAKAVVGGEGNGGLIYPGIHQGRDGLMAAIIILQYLAESGKTISALAGELPSTVMVKRKLQLGKKKLNFDKLIKAFPEGKADKRDGIKIVFDDCWLQLRLSNTEPIARLMTEALSAKQARSLADKVEKIIN